MLRGHKDPTFMWYDIIIYSTPIADTPQGSYIYIVQHNYYPTSVAEAPQKSYIYIVQLSIYSTPVADTPKGSLICMVQHNYLVNPCCWGATKIVHVHGPTLLLRRHRDRTFTWYNVIIYSTPVADTPQGSYIYIVQHVNLIQPLLLRRCGDRHVQCQFQARSQGCGTSNQWQSIAVFIGVNASRRPMCFFACLSACQFVIVPRN